MMFVHPGMAPPQTERTLATIEDGWLVYSDGSRTPLPDGVQVTAYSTDPPRWELTPAGNTNGRITLAMGSPEKRVEVAVTFLERVGRG